VKNVATKNETFRSAFWLTFCWVGLEQLSEISKINLSNESSILTLFLLNCVLSIEWNARGGMAFFLQFFG